MTGTSKCERNESVLTVCTRSERARSSKEDAGVQKCVLPFVVWNAHSRGLGSDHLARNRFKDNLNLPLRLRKEKESLPIGSSGGIVGRKRSE